MWMRRRGWGLLVQITKQQKGKLKGQLPSAQVTLLACRSASGPHLVAHRFLVMESKDSKTGFWREPRLGALRTGCQPLLVPFQPQPLYCRPAGLTPDSLKCLAHQPSLCRHSLPAPPPASTEWQWPHQGCPFKSLPPLTVWTNQGPCPPSRQLATSPPHPQSPEM